MPRRRRNVAEEIKENVCPDESILPDESSAKMLNKESYLKDFDMQVADRIKRMDIQVKKILRDLNRLAKTEKLKINEEIRSITVKEFLERGGNLDALECKELSTSIIGDISYLSPQPDDTVTASLTLNAEANATIATATTAKSTNGPRKLLRGKRELPESSLVRSAMRNTRTRKNDFTTPHIPSNKLPAKKQLVTPMITPKFDPSKPLTAAREPKHGETLVSLAGSPVVKALPDKAGDDSHLVSISLMAQQTILGGSLFLDEEMSPNTLLQRKQIIEEAVSAINSRLEELNSQVSAGSKLDES